jgi:putative ABC transport system permease protein
MRIPVVQGRAFESRDGADAPPVAILNQAMARDYWPDADPVGQRIKFGPAASAQPWITIVGVSGDVRHSALQEAPRPEVYVPQAQNPNSFMYVAVRSSLPPDALLGQIAERIHALDRALPVFQVKTLAAIVDETMRDSRMSAGLIGAFGLAALILAVGGTYGVVAYAMSQRTREIGLRLALGAQRGDLMRLLLVRGAGATAFGAMIGVTAALGVVRVMRTMLFGVGLTDPATFVLAPAALVVMALIACAVPAWRATRLDPASVLRAE